MRNLANLDNEELLVAYVEAVRTLLDLDADDADEDEREAAEYVADEVKAELLNRMN